MKKGQLGQISAFIIIMVISTLILTYVIAPTLNTADTTTNRTQNVSFTVYPSINNGTFTTVYLNTSYCNAVHINGEEKVFNNTFTGVVQVLTRTTNYTLTNGGILNMTSYNTTWKREGAGPIAYNNTAYQIYFACDDPGAANFTGTAAGTVNDTNIVFTALFLLVIAIAGFAMVAKHYNLLPE